MIQATVFPQLRQILLYIDERAVGQTQHIQSCNHLHFELELNIFHRPILFQCHVDDKNHGILLLHLHLN